MRLPPTPLAVWPCGHTQHPVVHSDPRPPADEPQGWWVQFTSVWRTYLTTQQHSLPAMPGPPPEVPAGSDAPAARPTSSTSSSVPRRSRPTTKRTRRPPLARRPQSPPADSPSQPSTTAVPPTIASIQRPGRSPPPDAPPRKRQVTITSWFHRNVPLEASPAVTPAHPQHPGPSHGRATEGPPT